MQYLLLSGIYPGIRPADVLGSLVNQSHLNPEDVGFLRDERRLNVAMTRARRKLIMIGNTETLSRTKIFARMIDHVRKNGDT